jgi:hypothetical protein
MASNKTVVKGIRASQEFFDKCDLVAKSEGVDRNKLIVRVVEDYLYNFEWLETTTLGDSKSCWVFSRKEDCNDGN